MVVCLAARVLCRGSRMALCRRSDGVGVNVLYSKRAMRRGSRVWSCEQSSVGVVVPCRDLLLFRPASGDPVAASQWRKRDRYGMTSCVPTLPKTLMAS